MFRTNPMCPNTLLEWFSAEFLASNINTSKHALCIGQENTATAVQSTAVGQECDNRLFGSLALSSGMFSRRGDAQHYTAVARIQTTNATPAELRLDGSSERISIPQLTTWCVTGQVVARKTSGTAEGAGYTFTAVLRRDTTAASTTLIGAATVTALGEDDATWGVAVTADTTNGALAITVTGAAAKDINWVAALEITQTQATTV